MPQVPIILPLIVAGILFGSLLKNQRKSISKKRLGAASGGAGLLNGIHAYLLDTLSPQPTTTTFARGTFTLRAAPVETFVATAVVVGFLIVLVIAASALIYLRLTRGKEEAPEEKEIDETLV